MGQQKKQAQDELREVIAGAEVLLRQEHHPEDGWEAICLPVCVRPAKCPGVQGGGGAEHGGARPTPRQVLNQASNHKFHSPLFLISVLPPPLPPNSFLNLCILKFSFHEGKLSTMQLEPKMYRNLKYFKTILLYISGIHAEYNQT